MKKFRTLIAEDNVVQLEICATILQEIETLEVVSVEDSRRAKRLLDEEKFDILITDIDMPHINGIELLKLAKQQDPSIVVLITSASREFEVAIEAFRSGAFDYLTKPLHKEALLLKVRQIIEKKTTLSELDAVETHYLGSGTDFPMIGQSLAMRDTRALAQKIGPKDIDVVITGETGTGKEVMARFIHNTSQRAKRRFVPFECAAIPETLLESELFGYRQGAFTGATKNRLGLIPFANQGTLLLDELGEMPQHLQSKILRVLQERKVRPVGAREELDVDVRVIAATSQDLHALAEKNVFRKDLLYRLDGASIHLPPLREREDDTLLLANHFLSRNAGKLNKTVARIGADACEILAGYSWPGNIRQLQNAIKYAIVMCETDQIEASDLPDRIVLESADLPSTSKHGFFKLREDHIASFELKYLTRLIESHQGNVQAAATEAKLPRGTFYRLVKKHGLVPKSFKA